MSMKTSVNSPFGILCALGSSFFTVLAMTVPMGISSPAAAASPEEMQCGSLQVPGQYGPFDYRTATSEQKILVEGAHFTPDVELLRSGAAQLLPGPDIAYTLRAFPNHTRALKSMMDLAIRDKTTRPFGSRWSVNCWFSRAVRFAPDDPQVRMIYGIFLLRSGEKKAAIAELEVARSIGVSSGNFQYNLGLAYFQVQDYEKARQQAYKARELGYQLDGLKNMLTRAGQWREPDPAPKDPAAAPTKETEAAPVTAPDAAAPAPAVPKS